MFEVHNYFLAITLCFLAMVCWGSWQNTRNVIRQPWRFELFYWDFTIGILIFSLLSVFTLGSIDPSNRTFLQDIAQAQIRFMLPAMLGALSGTWGRCSLRQGLPPQGWLSLFPSVGDWLDIGYRGQLHWEAGRRSGLALYGMRGHCCRNHPQYVIL